MTPSNRVPIYAPRFAAVRKVFGLEYHEAHERVAGVENPVRLNSQDSNRIVTTAIQPTQPVLEHNFRSSVASATRRAASASIAGSCCRVSKTTSSRTKTSASFGADSSMATRRRGSPNVCKRLWSGRATSRCRSSSKVCPPTKLSARVSRTKPSCTNAAGKTAAPHHQGGVEIGSAARRSNRLHAPLRQRRGSTGRQRHHH